MAVDHIEVIYPGGVPGQTLGLDGVMRSYTSGDIIAAPTSADVVYATANPTVALIVDET